jgi:hypothetical protein
MEEEPPEKVLDVVGQYMEAIHAYARAYTVSLQ